jgi:hypothetical protein
MQNKQWLLAIVGVAALVVPGVSWGASLAAASKPAVVKGGSQVTLLAPTPLHKGTFEKNGEKSELTIFQSIDGKSVSILLAPAAKNDTAPAVFVEVLGRNPYREIAGVGRGCGFAVAMAKMERGVIYEGTFQWGGKEWQVEVAGRRWDEPSRCPALCISLFPTR